MSKYLVTSALPYANGKLHIGHLAGAYLPADIFVRFLKLTENDVIYICGTDEHGAPISIKAESEGVNPKEIVNRYHNIIKKGFDGVSINFDNFSGTSREIHHEIAQKFFLELLENKYIETNETKQFYCESCNRFLADRYVEGICPHCKSEGARGDQCDACGHLIDVETLEEPKCKICNSSPYLKNTTHWFLNLPKFENKLRSWLNTKNYWKDNVFNFILSWLDNGLMERAITRDIDWGIPVPLDNAEGKVLYVWFDAPIGYISSTVEWAKKIGEPEKWKEYWKDESTKLIHFIGKDNIPFHTIIWPSIIMGQNTKYILPYDVPANEYLNLEGNKISTSRNWAIWVDEFIEKHDGDYLRYVLAANSPENKDSDFSWKDFQNRINLDLANVLGNLANRTFTFIKKFFDGKIEKNASMCEKSKDIFKEVDVIIDEITDCYKNYRVRKCTKLIIDIARIGNKFFDDEKPWVAVKNNKGNASETLYVCLEIIRKISIVFSPIIPNKMIELRKMMNLSDDFNWKSLNNEKLRYEILEINPLFSKVEDSVIEEEIKHLEQKTIVENDDKKEMSHKKNISFDDFLNLEIRIVKIIEAQEIKSSKKLLKLKITLGNEDREVVSGIKQHYDAKELIGKKVVMLLNLPARKIMGVKSQGMILAAEDSKGNLSLLSLDKDLDIGSEIS